MPRLPAAAHLAEKACVRKSRSRNSITPVRRTWRLGGTTWTRSAAQFGEVLLRWLKLAETSGLLRFRALVY